MVWLYCACVLPNCQPQMSAELFIHLYKVPDRPRGPPYLHWVYLSYFETNNPVPFITETPARYEVLALPV